MASAIPPVAIVLRVDGAEAAAVGAKRVSSAVGGIGAAAASTAADTRTATAVLSDSLATIAARFGGVYAAQLLVRKGMESLSQRDAYTALQARLQLLTGTAEGSAQAMASVFAIAQRGGVGLEEVGSTYVRVGNAIKTMGGGALETARIVETLQAALKLNGATTAEASSVMLQFGQALAKGRVNGDEFASIMENAPTLMDAVARALGKSKGEMYALAQAGELTSDVFARGVLASFSSLTEAAQGMPRTLGQANQAVANAFSKLTGESAAASASAKVVVGALGLLADHAALVANVIGGTLAAAALVAVGRLGQYAVASLAASAATRVHAASSAALVASLEAEMAAAGMATAAKSRFVLAGTALVRVLGGPVGIAVSLAAAAAAWLAYKAATGEQSDDQQLLEQIKARTEALKKENDELERSSDAGKKKAKATQEETIARLAQAVVDAQARVDAALAKGSAPVALVDRLGKAQNALAEFSDAAKASDAELARAAARTAASLQAPDRSLDSILRDLPTREKIVGEYSKTVLEIARSTAQAFDKLANEGPQRPDALAGIMAQRDAANAAAKKALDDGLRGLGSDARAQADAGLALTRARSEATVKLAQESLRQQEDVNQRAYDSGIISLEAYYDKRYRIEQERLAREIELKNAALAEAQGKSAAGPGAQDQKRATIAGIEADIAVLRAKASSMPALGGQEQLERARDDARAWAEAWVSASDAVRDQLRNNEQAALGLIDDPMQRARSEIGLQIKGLRERAQQQLQPLEWRVQLIAGQAGEARAAGDGGKADGLDAQAAALRAQIDAYQRAIDQGVSGKVFELKGLDDKANRERAQALSDSLAEGILDGFRRGGSLADVFLAELKAQFAKTVLSPLIKPMVEAGNTLLSSGMKALAMSFFGVPGRAAGGPVAAGGLYLVGERGPELLRMGSVGGTVIPNAASAQAAGSSATTFDFSGQVINVGQGVSRGEVAAALGAQRAAIMGDIRRQQKTRGYVA